MSGQLSNIDAPSLEPIGEAVENEHSEFSAQCLALVAPFVLKSNLEFRRGLVTRSAKWGLIWRGDYAIADLVAPNLINRIMCWAGADAKLVMEIAIGQRIAPLPVAPRDDTGDNAT